MTQQRIIELLREAGSPGCPKERRDSIADELMNAACPEGYPTSTYSVMSGQTRIGASQYLGWEVKRLFNILVGNRPDMLVSQAVFFLVSCQGNKREPVDWSLIS